MLILVAGDQPEGELVTVLGQGVEVIEHLVSDGRAVGPRLGRGEQRQVHAAGARIQEGVVATFDVRIQHSRATGVVTAQQPELLLPTDVREVPGQRAHEGVVLAEQFGVVELDQSQGALAGLRQFAGEQFASAQESPPGVRATDSSTAADSPLATTRSEKSSAGLRPSSTCSTSRAMASLSSAGASSAAA